MTTAAGGRNLSQNSSSGTAVHSGEGRKLSFNVLLDEMSCDSAVEEPKADNKESKTEESGKKEESLEQLLTPAVTSPTSSMGDETEWATASSSKHSKAKPQRPSRTPVLPAGHETSAAQQNANRNYHSQHYYSSHSGSQHHPHNQNRPPKEPVVLNDETTLEFYDFPASFRTNDLKTSLHGCEHRYRIKWHNDTSCYFVFESAGQRDQAAKFVADNIAGRPEELKFKVRVYQSAATVATADSS